MPARKPFQGPQLGSLNLPELGDGAVVRLGPHADLSELHFAGVDFTGVELSGASFSECLLERITAAELRMRNVRILESRVDGVNTPSAAWTGATLREVEVANSRIGAIDLAEADLRSVLVEHCKLDWVNLRSAVLTDVLFRDCTFGELDLTGAQGTRVAFENCRAETVTVSQARLQDTDLRGPDFARLDGPEGLRGVAVDERQLMAMTETFAKYFGVRVMG